MGLAERCTTQQSSGCTYGTRRLLSSTVIITIYRYFTMASLFHSTAKIASIALVSMIQTRRNDNHGFGTFGDSQCIPRAPQPTRRGGTAHNLPRYLDDLQDPRSGVCALRTKECKITQRFTAGKHVTTKAVRECRHASQFRPFGRPSIDPDTISTDPLHLRIAVLVEHRTSRQIPYRIYS